METMMKDNLGKLRNIFLYYDSEPMELLQGLVWLFLLMPMTLIELGFKPLLHLGMITLSITQIIVVLNYSLNARKILSFVMFSLTIAITLNYVISGLMWQSLSFMVFLFNSFFAFFNLKRLTIEKMRRK